VSTVTSSQPLLGSTFKWWAFPFLWVHKLFPASAASFQQQQLMTEPQHLSHYNCLQLKWWAFPFLWVHKLFPASAASFQQQQLMTEPQHLSHYNCLQLKWWAFPFFWVHKLFPASATSFQQQQLMTEPQHLSHYNCLQLITDPTCNILARTKQKHFFHYCYIPLLQWKHACLQNHYIAVTAVQFHGNYLAMDLHTSILVLLSGSCTAANDSCEHHTTSLWSA
jgi:hypothetical protein